MSRKLSISLLFAICIILGGISIANAQGTAAPQPEPEQGTPLGTAFTYQGRLQDTGGGVTGDCDLQFSLYASSGGGDQIGSTLERLAVAVEDGYFTVADLDFGAGAFNGEARWLGVAVRCPAGEGNYEPLSPRQALTAAPYALYTPGTHDHLGQTWTGTDQPLKIEGSYDTFPDKAALVLNNSGYGDGLHVSSGRTGVVVESTSSTGMLVSASGYGVYVDTAGYGGFTVSSAGYDGVLVGSSGHNGVKVGEAGRAGLHVYSAGEDGVFVDSAGDNGVSVATAGGDGVYVESVVGDGFTVEEAGEYGVYAGSAGYDGVHVELAGFDGVYVHQTGGFGVNVFYAGTDGFLVNSAGRDGVRVVWAEEDGVDVSYAIGNGLYIGGAGINGAELWNATYDGVQVNDAGRYGVQANTTATYGFITQDAIYAGSGCVGCTSMLIAQNGGEIDLEPGDLVALDGLAEPFNPESVRPVLVVRKAEAASPKGVIGVVEGHYVYEETGWPTAGSDSPEDEASFSRRVTESIQSEPAAPGEYLVVVYSGMVRVKIDAWSSPIQAGDLLTVADTPGHAVLARPMALESGGEPGTYASGSVIGKALEALDGDTGLIWVLVDLQ